MKRLTKKCKDENGRFYAPNTDDVGETIENEIFQKLGKLEDLEEQIGMPLEKFVKIMLSSTFYVLAYEPCEIVEVRNDGVSFDKERPRFNLTSKADVTDAWSITLQDFSKYAFLTYEEAEKKLEGMKNE